ncbi:HipA domain-containing protein [Sphaerisporangium sp. NPDC088356]|uniref:HipA domain-containing protein n=1 Tax=Sphaerisporangium sp. NPDC088356 TaxID=3154871 RepID=UPI0034137AE1
MTESFQVVDATDWPVDLFEAGGSEEKVWLNDPKTGRRALFKPNVRHDNAEQADHWLEKFASELARLMGVPAADIDLVVRDGRRGCVSYDVKPSDGWELQPGWLLLAHLLGNHDPMDRQHQGHTLPNIREVLKDYGQPPGFVGPADLGAFDVFVGYLVLDGLIANRDRHPANWSVLRGPGVGDQRLSPSYDHATSLGFSLTDEERTRKLRDEREWEAFLRRGTAHRFEGCRQIPLVDFASEALGLLGPGARGYWLDRLAACNEDRITCLAASIPEMSEAARRFAVELVDTNRRRLLDA